MISQKLATTYTLMVVLLVTILAACFYQYTYYTLYEEGTSNLNQLCGSTMAQIDSRLKALEETAVTIASDQIFLTSLTSASADPENADYDASRIKSTVQYYCVKRSELRRANVMTTEGFLCGTGVVDYAGKASSDEFTAAIHGKGESRKFFLPPHIDNWNSATPVEVYSLIKPIKDRNAQIIGYVELQENMHYIRKICDNKWNNISLGTLILDENNEVFYTNLEDSEKNRRLIDEALAVSNTFAPRIKTTPNAVLSISNSNFNYFKTVLILEKAVLYNSMNTVLYGILLMAALLIILTCLFIFFSSRAITRPVNMLVERMNKTELENMNEPFEDIKIRDYETDILIRTFDRMTLRLKGSITKQNAMQNAQTKTLFSALQATISPHFMYNTLGGIANMCEGGDSEAAADACYSLTELLRYASDYTTYDVELDSEIHNLKNYLSIMKSRYRQRLEYSCELDPAAASFILPKLTVQPLVENSIKNSLTERETVVVSVSARMEGETLVLEVCDNGRGITPEQAEQIKTDVRRFMSEDAVSDITAPLKFGGMGLIGTLLRLSIYCGDGFCYSIGSGENGGACIRFEISGRDNGHV